MFMPSCPFRSLARNEGWLHITYLFRYAGIQVLWFLLACQAKPRRWLACASVIRHTLDAIYRPTQAYTREGGAGMGVLDKWCGPAPR
ncbi:uncharacterized protein F4807DRAFT_414048 [Annulohypoxylon truncatum]|uniref:uncharacterized protein n=1 Tax=Annulohypoxylon truncatum TaxID=327061 RepID=UPI0020078AE4|nr:uncharacterized protein F4807DRAFT_414048 [Annulohypoxylon truncatum]KAI1212683.1 hypothetical protein F4807DRAFT_414048 [Annulohypoxylon truncatum]